jgi:NADH-quinone oxidoreductase subunit A
MTQILLSTPMLFIFVLVMMLAFYYALSRFAFRQGARPEAQKKPYACGEDMPFKVIQPDYSQFFPFAFYFTILHVVALFIATVPTEINSAFWIAVLYIIGAIIGLFILLEK